MIKDPYIGMPIIMGGDWNKPSQGDGTCDCCDVCDTDTGQMNGTFDQMYLGSLPLAMCYVPFQKWKTTYPGDTALERGTLFPELDLPFEGGMKR